MLYNMQNETRAPVPTVSAAMTTLPHHLAWITASGFWPMGSKANRSTRAMVKPRRNDRAAGLHPVFEHAHDGGVRQRGSVQAIHQPG